ncbi:hypothetical protein QX776_17290 [Alteromonadaceae bacterium BrNp21-10]|nr:hypothetical protein [Alteromonadaceae bacterium BrNp21-10]
MKNRIVLVLLVLCSLVACTEDVLPPPAIDATPEDTALNFFDGIYNKQNLDQALYLSSPRMTTLLQRYVVNQVVQRHVLNLSYDMNKVEITLDTGGNKMRTQYSKNSKVNVFFTGYRQDKKIEDIRVASMVKVDGHWRVDSVSEANYH